MMHVFGRHAVRIAFAVVITGLIAGVAVILTLPNPPAPADADQTLAELGRRLFYDRRLSANERIACASCHQQERGFSDGLTVSFGVTGAPLLRNTPGLFNSGELTRLTWANPDLTDLERQIHHPLFAIHPPEMGVTGNEAAILARIRADSDYRRDFTALYPAEAEPIAWPRIIAALAAFTGSLHARNTSYDRYVYQDDHTALTIEAQRGMALFFSPGLACGHCHVDIVAPERATPPRWADLEYLATGAGRSADRGLAEVTGDPADAYRFRTPPLRNVAVTAPYMHDGSLATLEAVVRFYESGGRVGAGAETERLATRHPLIAGFMLSDAERRDLIVFLHALTDETALRAPEYADPFRATGQ